MKATTEILIGAGAILAVYFLWKTKQPYISPQETAGQIATAHNTSSRTTPLGTFVTVGNTTYKTDAPLTTVDSPQRWQTLLTNLNTLPLQPEWLKNLRTRLAYG